MTSTCPAHCQWGLLWCSAPTKLNRKFREQWNNCSKIQGHSHHCQLSQHVTLHLTGLTPQGRASYGRCSATHKIKTGILKKCSRVWREVDSQYSPPNVTVLDVLCVMREVIGRATKLQLLT